MFDIDRVVDAWHRAMKHGWRRVKVMELACPGHVVLMPPHLGRIIAITPAGVVMLWADT